MRHSNLTKRTVVLGGPLGQGQNDHHHYHTHFFERLHFGGHTALGPAARFAYCALTPCRYAVFVGGVEL